MATKDDKLFKLDKFQNDIVKNEFADLNLNQGYQCPDLTSSVHSNSTKNSNSQLAVTIKTDASSNFSEQNVKDKRVYYSWEKTMKKSCFEALNELTFYQQDEKHHNQYKNTKTTINSSTLSLHISAYENSIEGASSTTAAESHDKKESMKKENRLLKKWKNVKQIFTNAATTSEIRNPFEFPRQQEDKPATEPEVMQFKTSQRLLNVKENQKDSQEARDTEANEKPQERKHYGCLDTVAPEGTPISQPQPQHQMPPVRHEFGASFENQNSMIHTNDPQRIFTTTNEASLIASNASGEPRYIDGNGASYPSQNWSSVTVAPEGTPISQPQPQHQMPPDHQFTGQFVRRTSGFLHVILDGRRFTRPQILVDGSRSLTCCNKTRHHCNIMIYCSNYDKGADGAPAFIYKVKGSHGHNCLPE